LMVLSRIVVDFCTIGIADDREPPGRAATS
jgi:hypothetical protein